MAAKIGYKKLNRKDSCNANQIFVERCLVQDCHGQVGMGKLAVDNADHYVVLPVEQGLHGRNPKPTGIDAVEHAGRSATLNVP